MKELDQLRLEYHHLLQQQQFDEDSLDYSKFDRWIPILDSMAEMKNSGITVFDLCKKDHIYSSYNFQNILGYSPSQVNDVSFFDARIHPDDYLELMKNGNKLFRFYLQLPEHEKNHYKLVREYRIKNHQDQYLNIIEQQKVLEMDNRGNAWLALAIMDISPNQQLHKKLTYQLINITNGEAFTLEESNTSKETILSKREKEILGLVTLGMLSKEISDQLNISIHTVNNHRQNILQKLNVHNSVEAVRMAEKLGIVMN